MAYELREMTILCAECDCPFTYQVRGRSRPRVVCSTPCRDARRNRTYKEHRASWPDCSIDGCDITVRSSGSPFCEKHYARNRLHGDPLGGRHRRDPKGTCYRCGNPAKAGSVFCSMLCYRRDRMKVPEHIGILNCIICDTELDESVRLDSTLCSEQCRTHFQRAKRYGVNPHELAAALGSYSGCAICRRADADPVIDHDHESGHVRGLLCSQCNIGIGMFGDDTVRLAGAIRYLSERTERGWMERVHAQAVPSA